MTTDDPISGDETAGEEAADAQRYVTWSPPGHFYSPIPDHHAIERDATRIFAVPDELPGIDLRGPSQLALFPELAGFARELDLPRTPRLGWRYHIENLNYEVGDGHMLGAFLRHLRPRRYLEVGSGWSTALALDVNERWLDGSMQVSAIEPHPGLLRSVIRPEDDVEILATPVQDVPLVRFATLEANDLLFIDSTHVVKVGSDTHFLLTRVLPSLQVGVYVHIHDVFWPFEYSRTWLDEGRAWNEDYFIHTFLLFNSAFEVVFFNNWFARAERATVEEELPAMLENPGGALWLRRIA